MADHGVDPLGIGSKGEVLIVNAVDVPGITFGPLDRLAQIGADLEAPRGIEAKPDLR